MKILEWNINQRAGWGNKAIPEFVAEEIIYQNAEIVILTEFCKTKNWEGFIKTLKSQYVVFTKEKTVKRQNEILIAIKTNNVLRIVSGENATEIMFDNPNKEPNFLRIDVEYKEQMFAIIGIRIRISNGRVADCDCRKEQLEYLTQYIRNIDNPVLIMGDFNNGEHWRKNKIWNWSLLEKEFKGCGYEIYTPTGEKEFSWYDYNQKGYKIDHIVVKGLHIKDKKYSWEFLNKYQVAQIYGDEMDSKPQFSYPDHAILTADLIISGD